MADRKKIDMAKSVTRWFDRLHDPDEQLRRKATRVLAGLTPDDKQAIPALIGYLKSSDPTFRYWAARGLSGIGKEATEAVPALVESLCDDNSDCRFWAVTALWSIGSEARDALPGLLERLQDPVFGVRQAAASALVSIAPTAEAVVPALVRMLQSDDNPYVRGEVIRALGKVETVAAAEALIAALTDADTDVRRWAGIGLKMLGAKVKQVVPEIRRILTTKLDTILRSDLAIALKRMEGE